MTHAAATPIIIDNGSCQLRCGFGGDALPRALLPNSLGVPRRSQTRSAFTAATAKQSYVGADAQCHRGILRTLRARRVDGSAADPQVTRRVWRCALLRMLRVAPEEHTAVVVDAPPGYVPSKCDLMRCVFEDFGFQGALLADSGLMNTYAHGRTNGLSVDLGEYFTRINAFWQGFHINDAVTTNPFGGVHLDRILGQMLLENGAHIGQYPMHLPVCRDIKEKYCYINIDTSPKDDNYQRSTRLDEIEMADGTSLKVEPEVLRSPNAIFDPESYYVEANPLHQAIVESVERCPIDLRSFFRKNILVCGGTSMIKGFIERLKFELPGNYRLVEAEHRDLSCWIGASIYSTLDSFSWIGKEAYYEHGPSILHRMCLTS